MAEVKKKIRPGAIQLHDSEAALLVHYEVQEVSTAADGSQELLSSSQATKKITVKSLSERTDLQALAAEIVDKCKLIHPSKTSLVQGLLQQLQQRELGLAPEAAGTAHAGAAGAAASGAGSGFRPSTISSNGSSRIQQQQQQAAGDAAQAAAQAGSARSPAKPTANATASALTAATAGTGSNRPASARPQSASRPHTASSGSSSRVGTPHAQQRHMPPPPQQQQQYRLLQASEAFQAYAQALTRSPRPAFLDDVEVYIEGLYEEELPQRAAAADMLCQLFRNSGNMQVLLSRETLLSTLARLLREDGPRSLDMATAVAGCFYACSCIKELHRQLLDNQVGSLLMDLVALEQQRTAAREAQEGPGNSAGALVAKAAATAAASRAGGREQQQQPQQPLDQREFRLLSLVVSQDRFLSIALAALLNLAEDAAVQRKMVKEGVTGLLLGLLGRPHLELLLLVAGFLRRLCVFAEGKARVSAAPSVIPQLVALLQPGCGEQLQCAVLRLLHNLSFDAALRQQMLGAGLVQQAVPLLDGARTAPLAAGLLYQLSMNDEARAAFCFCPGALSRLLDSILRALGPSNAGTNGGSSPGGLRTIPELIALAVNVAHSSGVAEWFHEGERLERLLQRFLATADELAWKLLRNLAVSGGALLAPCLLSHVDGMLGLLQSQDTGPELFVEVLGVLAAAADAACGSGSGDGCGGSSVEAAGAAAGSSGVAPWQLMPSVALQELLACLVACFQPGALKDDALLEAVVLLGALAGWAEGDKELADSGLLPQLVDLLPAKRSDDEFVLQACWAFRRALMQPASAHALLAHDQVVMYLVDLLQDPCLAVSRVAGGCLDVVIDSSDDMAGAIRSLKFEAFNQDWLKLAGPEAHQLMAAAAAWQQQQLQAYIQQLHSHNHQQQDMDPTATPFNTFVRGGAQQQQQQRRDAMSGYGFCPEEQQQAAAGQHGQGLEQYDFGGGQQVMGQFDGAVHGPPLAYGCFGEAGEEDASYEQQQQQQQEREQQQLQWVSSAAVPAGGGAGGQQEVEGGCMGRSSSMGRASMVTAAGQCMVLDFDAFVADSQTPGGVCGVADCVVTQ